MNEERKAKIEMRNGFTLLELLLVIAIIATLAGLIFFALNPADRIQEANETKYLANAKDIEKALNSYVVDNGGNLPSTFNSLSYGYYDICKQGQSGSCVSIDELVTSGKMSTIPVDSNNQTGSTTGFKVRYDPLKREGVIYSNAMYTERIESGTTLTEGLVGWWKMDEASWGTVADFSGRNNNGTALNGAMPTAGKFGNAGNFDGVNDYVDLGDINTYDYSNSEFTISAWVNIPALPSNAGACGPVSPIFMNNDYGYALRINGTGLVSFSKYISSGASLGTISSSSLPLNQYNHIVAIHKPDRMSIFVNGTLVGSNSIASGIVYYTAGDTPEIGRLNNCGGGNYYYNGKLDDLRIFNRALNTDEVVGLYEYVPPPIGYWKFDHTSGSVAQDSSGNGNDGVLVNGPNWIAGMYSNGLIFNGGSSYVNISDNGNNIIDLPNTFTFATWIKPSSTAGCNAVGTPMCIIFNKENSYEWAMNSSNTLEWAIANSNPGWAWVNTGITVPNNVWSHIALVYNGNSVGAFMNGVLSHTRASTIGNLAINDQDLRIGARGGDAIVSSPFPNVVLDDVRIYNYARTQEQIIEDMNNI